MNVETMKMLGIPIVKTVIILRGVSGSGKTNVANLINRPKMVCSNDDYYMLRGSFNYMPQLLLEAVSLCKSKFDNALVDDQVVNIVIANDNVKQSDYQYYVDKAEQAGVRVIYIVLEKRHECGHKEGVTDATIQEQSKSLINDLKLM